MTDSMSWCQADGEQSWPLPGPAVLSLDTPVGLFFSFLTCSLRATTPALQDDMRRLHWLWQGLQLPTAPGDPMCMAWSPGLMQRQCVTGHTLLGLREVKLRKPPEERKLNSPWLFRNLACHSQVTAPDGFLLTRRKGGKENKRETG